MKEKTTETAGSYKHLEKMSLTDILLGINAEDQKVAHAVKAALPQITVLAEEIFRTLQSGGRLFYLGAGTSGRLGILDASECPPTYGVPHGMVTGIIAGGDQAIRKAVEFAEDDTQQGWLDLQAAGISEKDLVVGIAASGTTPYVNGALAACRAHHIRTGCITCNAGSSVTHQADFPVEVVVGPEFVTGSTRMKSGTAQKLVLNMLSTSAMIRLGRVKGNKMVDMQLSNNKLVDRGTKMIMEELQLPYAEANELLRKYGSVRKAVESYKNDK